MSNETYSNFVVKEVWAMEKLIHKIHTRIACIKKCWFNNKTYFTGGHIKLFNLLDNEP